jgi:hypothetical protein
MKYYHAAPKETMIKIVGEGRIKKSWDGVVYLCKEAVDSCKFLVMRGMKNMSVIEVELDESEVEESNDHSEAFFKCKAYIHSGDIELTGNENVWDYSFDV